jgi:type II secretory pathway pseudopilin PulG
MMAGPAGESGVSLVEQLIAVALLGVLAVALLYGLSGGTLGVGVVDEQVNVANLAGSALESVKRGSYVTGTTTYSPTLSTPGGYAVTVAASQVITGLQWITATVYHNGRAVGQISDYKANR